MPDPGSAPTESSRPAGAVGEERPSRAAEEPPLLVAIRRAPPLAALAASAALLDLVWNRIAVRLIDPNARELWIPLAQHGRVVRNLTGIAAIVATLVALVSLVRIPSPIDAPWKTLFGRLTIAGVAGLYIPGIALALVAPREHVPSLLVVLGLLSGNALVAVLASATLAYWRVPPAWASLAAGLTAFLAMIGLLVASLRNFVPVVGALGLLARHGAEVGWLLTPLLLLLDRSVWSELRLERSRAALALVVFVVVLGAAVLGHQSLGDVGPRIAYGAFRIAMLPAAFTWVYGVPIALSVALATFHVSSPAQRQVGLGMICWIAAGLAPRTPLGTLVEVTAALLFARAALAAHPDGRARLVPYQGDVERVLADR